TRFSRDWSSDVCSSDLLALDRALDGGDRGGDTGRREVTSTRNAVESPSHAARGVTANPKRIDTGLVPVLEKLSPRDRVAVSAANVRIDRVTVNHVTLLGHES